MEWFKKKEDRLGARLGARAFFVLLAVLGLLFVAKVYWSYLPIGASEPTRPATFEEYGAVGDYFGGLLNPVFAFFGFLGLLVTIRQQADVAKKAEIKHDDEKYIAHAIRCLERAYATLEEKHSALSQPRKNQLAWLTCARLILSAKAAYERLSQDATPLKVLYEGEEEYWRKQFYDLVIGSDGNSVTLKQSYFEYQDSVLSKKVSIDERSVRVVFDFANAPKQANDPIDLVQPYSLGEALALPSRMQGFQAHLVFKHQAKVPTDRDEGDRQ